MAIKPPNNLLSFLVQRNSEKKTLQGQMVYRINLVGDLMNSKTYKVQAKIEIKNMYKFKIKFFLYYFEVRDSVQ